MQQYDERTVPLGQFFYHMAEEYKLSDRRRIWYRCHEADYHIYFVSKSVYHYKVTYNFTKCKKPFLLFLSGKTITEAAMLANFDSPSHFAAVTKRMMGMPASLSSKNSVFLKVCDV